MDFEPWFTAIKKISGRYFILAGVAFIVFYILFPKAFQKIKIQKLFPKPTHYYRDIFFSIISMLLFATAAYICFAVLKPYNNINYGPVKNYFFYALSFVWMFILHDTYFYWLHRLMHQPALFKSVHLIHHKSTNPSPWTAYAFHPLEAVLESGKIKTQGYIAWLGWMFLHLMLLVGYRNRLVVFTNWMWNYFSYDKAIRLIIRPYKKI